MKRFHALLALTLLLGARVVLAQNQVQNPGFDSAMMLTSWSAYASSAPDPVGTGTGVWDATQDVNLNPASGSAHVNFLGAPAGANAAYGIKQCVDLSAGILQPVMSATFGVRFQIPTGQLPMSGANATVDVAFFDTVGCTGNLITGGSQGKTITPTDPANGTWYTAEILSPVFPIAPLASPQSAEFRLVARRVGTNGETLSVFFDAGYLAVNGALPVTLQRFEVE